MCCKILHTYVCTCVCTYVCTVCILYTYNAIGWLAVSGLVLECRYGYICALYLGKCITDSNQQLWAALSIYSSMYVQ